MRTESPVFPKIFFDPYGATVEWKLRRIKAARALAGKSAHTVAADIDLGIATYKKIESGARRATDGELWQIARSLGVEVDYFLNESLRPFPPLREQAQSTAELDVRTSPDTLARRDMLDTHPRPERSGGFESTLQPQEDPHESQG